MDHPSSDHSLPHPSARSLPLDGVTVIAVEQYGAGPFGTMLMADLGAEVIKIENPAEGGDIGRHVGPYVFGPGDSQFFQAFNRNKRSMTLNLKHPEGMRILRQLVSEADAVLDNLRGDLPEKLGLDYASLKAVNPAIVCAHLSAYGRDNERKSWPGYDYLMQAEAGYCSLTGEPAGPLRLVDRGYDDRADVRVRLGLRGAGCAAHRDRHGRGRQPVRYGPAQSELPGDLVSQRGASSGSRTARRASIADAIAALPYQRRLDVLDV
jgi:crotonobetainyl-CoA:carnitine CoA-transferase CaiB-like acyl-CoA transferase